jgi:signal transduction histidine kinase/CheY-like chemotaxis protein
MRDAGRQRSGPAPRGLAISLASGGHLGQLIGGNDWSATPLGPIEDWGTSLCHAVGICVASRFPIVLFWGPDLVVLYNDAYLPMLGDKHPASLGRSGRQVWGELWPVIGDMLRGVMERGEATWSDDLELGVNRRGFVEEAYFTFSYSPVVESDGDVAGVFCAVAETTAAVLSQRRWICLQELAGSTLGAAGPTEACESATTALSTNGADLPLVALYLRGDQDQLQCCLVANGGSIQPQRQLEQVPADVRARLLDGTETGVVILPPEAMSRGEPARYAVGAIGQGDDRRPLGLAVLGLSSRLVLDRSYLSFIERVVGQVSASVNEARAIEAMRTRATALAELDQAKTAFLANVSHELRTPLTLVLSPLEDGLGDPHPTLDDQRERMELAHRSASRLLRLVNSLLDFSRLQSGRNDAQFVPMDLSTITADLAATFRSLVERAGLAFNVEVEALPSPVWVDTGMWETVVLNLLSNAFKYTLSGAISVRVEEVDGRPYMSVADTGIGVSASEQGRLFERFHRVSSLRARTFEGTGIGLALVRDLVALHGGDIEVRSEPEIGSTFTVGLHYGHGHLPPDQLGAASSDGLSSLAAAYAREAEGWLADDLPLGPPPARADGPLQRLLVVDDNADMRSYLRRLLQGPWEVTTAVDGQSALEALRSEPFDLVLTDVMMPRLDGFELVQSIRSDPALTMLPVIMLSARAGKEATVSGLDSGADDYLSKPFVASELRARVRANLELAAARDFARVQNRLNGLLARAGELLVSTTDPSEALDTVVKLAVPALGDWACVHLLEGTDRLVPAGGTAADPELSAHLERFLAGYRPSVDDPNGAGRVIATGDPQMLAGIKEDLLRASSVERPGWELIAALSPERAVIVPLWGRRGPVGALSVVRTKPRPFEPAETEFIEELGRRAGRALESALLFEQERQIATALQRRLLPKSLPVIEGLAAYAVYEPGMAGAEIGGDWYDVIDLGDGRVVVCVGDVVGHGPDAAAAMGQLRAAVRAYAFEGHLPCVVAERLSALVANLEIDMVTFCYTELNIDEGIAITVNAGHPPPVLVGETGADFLPVVQGRPLGIPSPVGYDELTTVLRPPSTLVYYSDGLVESRTEALDVGFERLLKALDTGPLDPEQLVCSLLQAMRPYLGGFDDLVTCAVAPGHGGKPRRATRVVREHPASVGSVRHWARAVLAAWDIPSPAAQGVELVISELIGNALTHATGTVTTRLSHGPHGVDVAVSDASGQPPRLGSPTALDEYGRGLQIVQSVCSDWRVSSEPGGGKTVHCRVSTAGTAPPEAGAP